MDCISDRISTAPILARAVFSWRLGVPSHPAVPGQCVDCLFLGSPTHGLIRINKNKNICENGKKCKMNANSAKSVKINVSLEEYWIVLEESKNYLIFIYTNYP